jgi:hypothetical protein
MRLDPYPTVDGRCATGFPFHGRALGGRIIRARHG